MRGFVLLAVSLVRLCAQTVVEPRCSAEMINELGLACSIEEPCPVFLELADVHAVGDRLVLVGNLHTGTTTLESVLLVSDDAGKNWKEGHSRIRNSVLDRIQFSDFEGGWISGHTLHPLPRDAFFLITSDGGKTWRKRAIFGETRPGFVDKFWFDTRTHGLLLIHQPHAEDGNKYELWESMTSGDSWSVKQVDSKPIPLVRPDQPSAWRVRPDAKTQVHRVEHQTGGKWDPVATFRVKAGECRPPAPPPEAEPPKQEVEDPPPTPARPPASKKPPSLKPKGSK
jgi:hypothetical protein